MTKLFDYESPEIKTKPDKSQLRARRVYTCPKCRKETRLVTNAELANPKCDFCGFFEERPGEKEYGRRA